MFFEMVVDILPDTNVSSNIYILIVIVYMPSSDAVKMLDKYILNTKPRVLVIIVNIVNILIAFIIDFWIISPHLYCFIIIRYWNKVIFIHKYTIYKIYCYRSYI